MSVDVNKEAKTLKEWLGNAIRSEGRKFRLEEWRSEEYFEPLFKDETDDWNGCTQYNEFMYCDDEADLWFEWTPPAKTKKVKLYKPVYRSRHEDGENYFSSKHDEWHTDKAVFIDYVGFIEQECEVADEG